jgi:hypothetical protein
MYATFERFEIRLTKAQALQGSHPGPCDEDIKDLLQVPAIKKQLDKISAYSLRAELREYGAWNEEELSNHEDNLARILWIACGNIREELRERES